MDGSSLIMEIKGVGPKTNELFGKLGLKTVEDLLQFYPRDYDRFEAPIPIAQSKVLDFAAVKGMVVTIPR